jgi:hypothetical protein
MKKLFLSTIAIFALIGCGGGGGSTSTNTETTVTAIDGYIKNATLKDSSGLTASYSSDGKYTFSKTPTYPITLTGGTLEDTNVSFDINMSAQSDSKVISPITTFLGNDTNLISIFTNLGLNQTALDEFEVDYIETNDIDLAKLSQLLYVILKDESLTTTFKQSLENNNSIDSLDKLFDLASSDINSSNWITAQKNCANTLLTKIKTFNDDPANIETYLKDDKTPFSQGCPDHAPTWTATSYDTGLTISDDNDDPKTIMDLKSVSSDADGDTLIYSIVSISTQNVNDDIPWTNSLSIQNGILQAQNLVTNDPNFDGTVTVTVKASDGTSSSNTTVNFDFLNYQ